MTDQQIYDILHYTAEPPQFLGPLHIFMLCTVLFFTVILTYAIKDISEKKLRIFLFISWIIILLIEAYRHVVYYMCIADGVIYWEFTFSHIPLQVCSLQLYVLPFVALLPNGKLRDAFINLMCIWSFFGGLCVTIYPGNTLVEYIGMTIQSMIYHGIQVVLGIALAVRYCHRMNVGYFFRGYALFYMYFGIAMTMNKKITEYIGTNEELGKVNFFFINRSHESTLPLLNQIRAATSYEVMVLTYLAVFTLAAVLVYQFQLRLTKKRREHIMLSGDYPEMR